MNIQNLGTCPSAQDLTAHAREGKRIPGLGMHALRCSACAVDLEHLEGGGKLIEAKPEDVAHLKVPEGVTIGVPLESTQKVTKPPTLEVGAIWTLKCPNPHLGTPYGVLYVVILPQQDFTEGREPVVPCVSCAVLCDIDDVREYAGHVFTKNAVAHFEEQIGFFPYVFDLPRDALACFVTKLDAEIVKSVEAFFFRDEIAEELEKVVREEGEVEDYLHTALCGRIRAFLPTLLGDKKGELSPDVVESTQ
jgi:hypothetical protein